MAMVLSMNTIPPLRQLDASGFPLSSKTHQSSKAARHQEPRDVFEACRDQLPDFQVIRSAPNKAAIRERLERGEDVPGARLTLGTQLRVR